jgi:hypothetical protein
METTNKTPTQPFPGRTAVCASLARKGHDDKLTRDQLACALYEGLPHLQNLAEKLARQHGKASALTFFDLMDEHEQNFWKLIADQLIEHASKWQPNKGSACSLDPAEYEWLKNLPRAKATA